MLCVDACVTAFVPKGILWPQSTMLTTSTRLSPSNEDLPHFHREMQIFWNVQTGKNWRTHFTKVSILFVPIHCPNTIPYFSMKSAYRTIMRFGF